MNRLAVATLIAAVLAAAMPAFSAAEVSIIDAKDHGELKERWCTADPNVEHVLVLPASLFVDSEELICDGAPYKLYRIIENDDPDDYEYFLDPPFGHATRLGCDGKAGRSMRTVALNCRPLH